MTQEQKIDMVQAFVESDAAATDTFVGILLAKAESAILRRMYPFDLPDTATVPAIYEMLQCELASRYFLRRGAEGEHIHNENGINRTYSTVNDDDLLSEVVPFVKMV